MILRNFLRGAADNVGMNPFIEVLGIALCTPIAFVSQQMRARIHFGFQAFLALSLLVAMAGCGSENPPPQMPPATSSLPEGTIFGTVVLGSPVRGMVVTAYRVDPATGLRMEKLAASEPTGTDGKYSMVLKVGAVPVVLEASGEGGTYTDLGSEELVNLDKDTVLRAAYRDPFMTEAGAFIFDGETLPQPGIIIGPWTELAYAYAQARRQLGKSPDLPDALARSYALFKEHLEYSFDNILPAKFADMGAEPPQQATPSAEQAHATLLLLGLSSFAERAHIKTNTTAALLNSLKVDVEGDGVFDGQGGGLSAIDFGTCGELCRLSGRTLRTDLANSIVYYLNSPKNRTGSGLASWRDLLTRISLRQSPLFASGDASLAFDGDAPEIKVIATTLNSEEEVRWNVGMSPEPLDWDARIPPVTKKIVRSRQVMFAETTPEARPRFTLNATTYLPPESELKKATPTWPIPMWRFEVRGDDEKEEVRVWVRVLRGNQVLRDWIALDQDAPGLRVKKPTYEVWLTSKLTPEIAMVEGDYELEIKTEDDLLNTATKKLYWGQSISTPPIRIVPAACDPCGDVHCPGYYSLGGRAFTGFCDSKPKDNNIDQLLEGQGPAAGQITMANVRIDNPNPFPIRVKFSYDQTTLSTLFGYVEKSCSQPGHNIEGCMWLTASSGVVSALPQRRDRAPIAVTPVVTLWKGADKEQGWPQPTPPAACPSCKANEFILPTGYYASVELRSSAWSSLLSEQAKASMGIVAVPNQGRNVKYYGSGFTSPNFTSVSVLGALKAQSNARLTFTVKPDSPEATEKPATGPDLTVPRFLDYNRQRYDELDWHWNWLDVHAVDYVEDGSCSDGRSTSQLCEWPQIPGVFWEWDPWLFDRPQYP